MVDGFRHKSFEPRLELRAKIRFLTLLLQQSTGIGCPLECDRKCDSRMCHGARDHSRFGTAACPKEGSQSGTQFESLGHPLLGGLRVCNIEQTAPCAVRYAAPFLGLKGVLPG